MNDPLHFNSEFDEDLAVSIFMAIQALPPQEQANAYQAFMGSALKLMPIEEIRDMRAVVLRDEAAATSTTASALDLIDGQLALREIAGLEGWR